MKHLINSLLVIAIITCVCIIAAGVLPGICWLVPCFFAECLFFGLIYLNTDIFKAPTNGNW